jgi:hypothetical protein
MADLAGRHRRAVLQAATEHDRSADAKSEVEIDHVPRAAACTERKLPERCRTGVVFQNGTNPEPIFEDPSQRKLLEPRHPMRALRNAAIRVDRTAERDADTLHDRVIDAAPAHDRLDQGTNGVDRDGRVGSVTNGMGAVNDPAISTGKRDTMPTSTDFDGNR